MKRILIILFALIAITSVMSTVHKISQEESRNKTTSSQKQDTELELKMYFLENFKAEMLARAKDPSSIQFRNMVVILEVPESAVNPPVPTVEWNSTGTPRVIEAVVPKESKKHPFICGEMNGKNSFGGYTGFQWFYKYPGTGLVINSGSQMKCRDIRNQFGRTDKDQ